MKKKVFDYIITSFTVASAALIILMLFMDLVHFDGHGTGTFTLDAYSIHYFWPNGFNASNEPIWWLAPGLICAAVVLFVPVVLNILGKKAVLFFWLNVIVLAVVVAVQFLGVDYSQERLLLYTGALEPELLQAFYFPYYAIGFSSLAALIFTMYGKTYRNQGDLEDNSILDNT